MLESTVERRFRLEVKKLGGEAKKLTSKRNDPDRIAIFPHGVMLFAELKQPRKKPRKGQGREHSRLRRMGFCVLVVDGTDWPRVLSVIRLRCNLAAYKRMCAAEIN